MKWFVKRHNVELDNIVRYLIYIVRFLGVSWVDMKYVGISQNFIMMNFFFMSELLKKFYLERNKIIKIRLNLKRMFFQIEK